MNVINSHSAQHDVLHQTEKKTSD